MNSLESAKLNHIYDILLKYNFNRTQSAIALEITVTTLRGYVRTLKEMKYIFPETEKDLLTEKTTKEFQEIIICGYTLSGLAGILQVPEHQVKYLISTEKARA